MFRFFEKLVELISMIQIAFFPIFVFAIIAIVCYAKIDEPLGFYVGLIILILGIILGIWYAIYIHKKRGATEFVSKISASPDLDERETK